MTQNPDQADLLPVMERFYTIQGEGVFSGHPAWFIRLAGCDVGCVWCDVKESWNAEGFPRISPDELAQEAADSGAQTVVITGGEPTMYKLQALTHALKNKGLKVHLETSAAYPITGTFDWICISPKKFKFPIPSQLPLANELKVIIYNRSDLNWAQSFVNQVSESCKLLMQPEWNKSNTILHEVIAFVKENPQWQISLQTHKFMNIP